MLLSLSAQQKGYKEGLIKVYLDKHFADTPELRDLDFKSDMAFNTAMSTLSSFAAWYVKQEQPNDLTVNKYFKAFSDALLESDKHSVDYFAKKGLILKHRIYDGFPVKVFEQLKLDLKISLDTKKLIKILNDINEKLSLCVQIHKSLKLDPPSISKEPIKTRKRSRQHIDSFETGKKLSRELSREFSNESDQHYVITKEQNVLFYRLATLPSADMQSDSAALTYLISFMARTDVIDHGHEEDPDEKDPLADLLKSHEIGFEEFDPFEYKPVAFAPKFDASANNSKKQTPSKPSTRKKQRH